MERAPPSSRNEHNRPHFIQDSLPIVITGIGVMTPIGCGKEPFWQSLADGRCGIGRLGRDTDRDVPAGLGGRVEEFRGGIEEFGMLDKGRQRAIGKALKLMNRETQLGVAAAQQALRDSRLLDGAFDNERVGVCFGAGHVSVLPEDFLAGIQACTDASAGYDFGRWGTAGLAQVAPLWLLKCLPNMPACYIAIFNDLRGPNNSITQREASANLALAEAYNILADGAANAMVVGATGNTLQPLNLLHELVDQDIAPDTLDPAAACRPFDLRRTGAVLAEGAAAFVVESWEHALRRGAPVYGEIIGAGSSCVFASDHRPNIQQALTNAMRAALHKARLTPESVGHLHAHGLSTPASDIYEARAIRSVFGTYADCLPVVAAKSNMGNAGAGSGAIELAASLLALQKGRLFRVLNYEEPDPECPIVPVRSDDIDPGNTLVNINAGQHGQASCVVIRKAG